MADDIRARRAERARQQKVKDLPSQVKRYLPLALIAVLVIVGVAWAATHQPPGKKFVHEHAAFAWFVEGQHVSFRSLDYDYSHGYNDVVHMHIQGAEANQNDVLHIEGTYVGGVPDWTIKHIFEQYGLKVSPGDITLDSKGGHNGQRYADQGNQTWHVYVSKVTGTSRAPFVDARNLTGQDGTAYIPRDLDKILITYGNPTPQELAQQEASIQDASEWRGQGATMG